MEYKKVDIIIPTYKPDEKFERLILGLLKQSYPIQNIYIICTKAGRFPWEIAWLDEKIKVSEIEPKEFNHGGTRKRAASVSDAEIFICMTQDAVPSDKNLIAELVKVFEDEKVACAYARQLPNADCDLTERYTRGFNYPDTSYKKDRSMIDKMGIKTFFCSNVCAAYRKSVYSELGGFEENAIFNEDMIMAARMIKAGYQCAYAAGAKVIHSHNYSCMQQFRRNFDLAVSQAQHPEIFEGVPSEKEGIRLVKQTARHLLEIRKPWLIASLFIKSGFKFIGYKLGRSYRLLPKKLVIKCSSNPKYWENVNMNQ